LYGRRLIFLRYIDVAHFVEKLAQVYQATQRYFTEENNLHIYRRENFKSV
jgi:hypothetical protein